MTTVDQQHLDLIVQTARLFNLTQPVTIATAQDSALYHPISLEPYSIFQRLIPIESISISNDTNDLSEDTIVIGTAKDNPLVERLLGESFASPYNVLPEDFDGIGVVQKRRHNGHTVFLISGANQLGVYAAGRLLTSNEGLKLQKVLDQGRHVRVGAKGTLGAFSAEVIGPNNLPRSIQNISLKPFDYILTTLFKGPTLGEVLSSDPQFLFAPGSELTVLNPEWSPSEDVYFFPIRETGMRKRVVEMYAFPTNPGTYLDEVLSRVGESEALKNCNVDVYIPIMVEDINQESVDRVIQFGKSGVPFARLNFIVHGIPTEEHATYLEKLRNLNIGVGFGVADQNQLMTYLIETNLTTNLKWILRNTVDLSNVETLLNPRSVGGSHLDRRTIISELSPEAPYIIETNKPYQSVDELIKVEVQP